MMENNLLEVFFPKLHSPCLCDTGWGSTGTEVTGSPMEVAEEPTRDNLLEVFFPKMYGPYLHDNGRSSSVVQACGSTMAVKLPSPFGIGWKNWTAAEEATREIIQKIRPTSASEERRSRVTNFVQRLIRDHLGLVVLPFGSVPLKTYIPDGDMDFTAFCGGNEDVLAGKLKALLQEAERNVNAEFVVKDVQLIPADVKLVKCMVQNIVIDISFNQIGGLCTLCFLEQIDRLIGKDHLFKRSIMLIKSWSYYESRIIGAQHRLISTYALEILVLHVFNLYHKSLHGPLSVLAKFLDYFSKFDWENLCVSVHGPVRLASLPEIIIEMPKDAAEDLLLGSDFLSFWIDLFSVPLRGNDMKSCEFQKKHLNIIDPLKVFNNLGRSVTKGNFYRICSAFTCGTKRLRPILLQPENCIVSELNKFFSNTLAWQERRCRPDVSLSGSPLCEFSGGLLSKGQKASQKQDGNSILTSSEILFHNNSHLATKSSNLLIDLNGDYDLYIEWLRYGKWYYDNALRLNASNMLSSPATVHQNAKLQFKQEDSPCRSHDDFRAPTAVCAMQNMIKPDKVFEWKDIKLEQGTTEDFLGLDQLLTMITRREGSSLSSPCTMIIRKEASSPGSPCIYKPNFIFEKPGMLVRGNLKPQNKKRGVCNSSHFRRGSRKGCPFTNDLKSQSNGTANFGSVEHASHMYVS